MVVWVNREPDRESEFDIDLSCNYCKFVKEGYRIYTELKHINLAALMITPMPEHNTK